MARSRLLPFFIILGVILGIFLARSGEAGRLPLLIICGSAIGVMLGFGIVALISLLLCRPLDLRVSTALVGPYIFMRLGDQWKRWSAGSKLACRILVGVVPKNPPWKSGQLRAFHLLTIAGLLAIVALGWLTNPMGLLENASPIEGIWNGIWLGFVALLAIYAIPYSFKGSPSAMMAVLKAGNPDFIRKVGTDTEMSRLVELPIRPRDWDRSIVDDTLGNSVKGSFDLWRYIIAYCHYWDSGERLTAFNILRAGVDVVHVEPQLPANVQSFWFEYAYAHAVFPKDYGVALDAYSKAKKIGGDFSKGTQLRALAAIKLIENDLDAVEKAILECEAHTQQFLEPGDERSRVSPEWLGELRDELHKRRQGLPVDSR